MPDASEAIQQALEGAAAGGDAESQSATTQTPEVAEAVKAALDTGEAKTEKTESASDESGEGTEDGDSKEQKTVPYKRLSEVVKQKNEISERYKTLEDQFKTATERERELRERVGTLEQDSQILDAIKNLAQDEKYKAHVVAIDKALQGIEDEIEDAKEGDDKKAVSDAEKRFEKKAAELDSLLADQRAERLWDEAAATAQSMLKDLPEEYTDDDRRVIGRDWTSRVDWNAIEEGKTTVREALAKAFPVAIKEYGTPRGALVTRTRQEVESRVPEAKIESDETALKRLLGTDWAETDKEGNLVHGEDDFRDALAETIKRTQSV